MYMQGRYRSTILPTPDEEESVLGGVGCSAGVAAGMPCSGGPELHLQAAPPRPAHRAVRTVLQPPPRYPH